MGFFKQKPPPRSARAPSKDHATFAVGWAFYLAPKTVVAKTLVTGGEPAEFSGASLTDAVSH
jgi:hypothetical protein